MARKPQINFQVDESLKLLYDEVRIAGHWVTRWCAAGLLMMVEHPELRVDALKRLRDWEVEYANASEDQVRDFVQGAEDAMQRAVLDSRRGQKARPARTKAKRG